MWPWIDIGGVAPTVPMVRIQRHVTEKPARGSLTFVVLLFLLGLGIVASLLLPAMGYLSPAWFTEREAFLGIAVALVALSVVLVVALVQLTLLRDQVAQIDVHRTQQPRVAQEQPVARVPARTARTARTTLPAPVSGDMLVSELEGIGRTYTTRMADVGIVTVPQLMAAPPRRLARRIGATSMAVRDWQAMGGLVHVDGVGPQYAEALVHAGIRSPQQLAQTHPEALAQRLGAVQEHHDVTLDDRAIGEGRTRRLVENARRFAGRSAPASARPA